MSTAPLEHPHGTFCWVDLDSHDLEAAAAWYGELFGWRVDIGQLPGGQPYGTCFLRDRPVGGIGEMSPQLKAQGVPPLWNSSVAVEDAAAIERRVVELGGKVLFPCTRAGEAGTFAYFADPSGAGFAVWQAGTRKGMQATGVGTWCWSELWSRDVSASRAFYGDLFGWRFEASRGSPEYTEIFVGDRAIGGIVAVDSHVGPPMWGVYFEVADVDASAATVMRTGGRVLVGPKTIEHVGRFCVATDPQGGCFSLIQMQHRDA